MKEIAKLKELYKNTSKHSNYQVLSEELRQFFDSNDIEIQSRNEKARLDYILQNIDIKNKSILDIGGNTGYFTFELLANGAKYTKYYEGNKEHAEFVRLASDVLNIGHQLSVNNEYYDFNESDKFDIVLLLNVLHHVGDDFGNNDLSREKALAKIIEHLNFMMTHTDVLVFQLGFNWKGDVLLPLFSNGTKKELIDFISNNLDKKYRIFKIGIAEKKAEGIVYSDLNEKNIIRDDSLGEFLNRPIFIIKGSK